MIFFRFSSDEDLRKKWISKINRTDWNPTKYTKICSCHFNNEDFTLTKKGLKRLCKGVIPTLRLDYSVRFSINLILINCSMHSFCFILFKSLSTVELQATIKSPEPSSNVLCEFLTFNDTPRKKKLKKEISQLKSKAKRDGLKIRRLQMKVIRLKKKVKTSTFI